jgi:hypothetical protein
MTAPKDICDVLEAHHPDRMVTGNDIARAAAELRRTRKELADEKLWRARLAAEAKELGDQLDARDEELRQTRKELDEALSLIEQAKQVAARLDVIQGRVTAGYVLDLAAAVRLLSRWNAARPSAPVGDDTRAFLDALSKRSTT